MSVEMLELEKVSETIDLKPQGWLGVRPCPKVPGRYQAWDAIDTRGNVVRPCTDLFDAMMWIQQHFASA